MTPTIDPSAHPARKILLAALAVALLSLFVPMQTGTVGAPVLMTGIRGMPVAHVETPIIETGFAAKPLAIFVVLGLLWVFLSATWQQPFWSRYGYWLAVALFVLFTPWMHHWLPFTALLIAGYAAYQNHKAPIQRPWRG